MSTYMAKPDEVEREWYVVDIAGETLGRIASKIATLLRGKHKPEFTPHVDTGDYVIVINADKVELSGNKWQDKKYYHHSQYPGGLREMTYEELLQKKPTLIIKEAVKGMLPHNKLGEKILRKLKIYTGEEHPHQAQEPKNIEL